MYLVLEEKLITSTQQTFSELYDFISRYKFVTDSSYNIKSSIFISLQYPYLWCLSPEYERELSDVDFKSVESYHFTEYSMGMCIEC